MSVIGQTNPAPNSVTRSHPSALAPLREPLFLSLWSAAVISYIGTWMQNVGAGWLMTQLTMSPFMISMVQASAALPVFLVILPAGALADMMDRRRLLLFTQGWMVAASAALGILTLTSCITPWTLLLFSFLLGLGSVMNDPAWQAITPEIVSPENHAPAVALNSAGFNVARALGPPLGGLVIAATSSGIAFLLNALSFFGVIFFLYRWQRPQTNTPRVAEIQTSQVLEAIRAGIHYVRDSDPVKSVMVRAGVFSIGATALLALLPLLARPFGSGGYGLLLGCFGVGALGGAAVLPRLRHLWHVDAVVAVAIVVFAGATFLAGRATGFGLLCVIMFVAGTAWIAILACLNVAAQTTAPSWVRARALSMYLLVLQGGMAVGSAAWGALASRTGVANTMVWSAAVLLAGLVVIPRHRLHSQDQHLAPSVVRD